MPKSSVSLRFRRPTYALLLFLAAILVTMASYKEDARDIIKIIQAFIGKAFESYMVVLLKVRIKRHNHNINKLCN